MKNSIVWLASYPKSGNTWTRAFLSNYLINPEQPIPINQMNRFGMGDSIAKTYHMVAGREINMGDLGLVLSLREKVLRGIVANNADINFAKTHNIKSIAQGVELIPDRFTRSAIYILRNPLDMVLSYARHYGMSAEQATKMIGSKDNASAPSKTNAADYLGTWSAHVESWTAAANYPVLVLRYEDLLEDPETHFAKAVEHVGLPVDEKRLKKAIKFSSFKELSKQEKKGGFVEKSEQAKTFFTKGTSGYWKDELDKDLVRRIRRDHRIVMKRYGYYDD
ncbi:sulfotransferase domain-containing protein [Roseovarius aestuarii]|uniref:Sulfotransferase domain protein n=1 Tax=Roseovarius aestuarii TaxID=475083 RepID=A0A1X7BLV1_9RHOB|nr:sulfotransferase domain-containing protein [Roseovarius aestuarii]SMC10606.1 Sulfotransferase domain protein [Roseovarius aestuarii]